MTSLMGVRITLGRWSVYALSLRVVRRRWCRRESVGLDERRCEHSRADQPATIDADETVLDVTDRDGQPHSDGELTIAGEDLDEVRDTPELANRVAD